MAAAKKEAMFVWEGKDKQGKVVKGELAGMSDALVKAKLRRQGINPLKVKKKPKPLLGGGGKTKITPKDITIFSRQLATMMSAGVPLVQAFEIVGRGHDNAGMQELILGVKADVEAGNSLTEAFACQPGSTPLRCLTTPKRHRQRHCSPPFRKQTSLRRKRSTSWGR